MSRGMCDAPSGCMQPLTRTSLTSLASVLLLAIAAPACSDEVVDEDEIDVAVDDGNDRGSSLEEDADDELGDADELDQMAMAAGILLAIDNGEIAHAQLAIDVDTTGDIQMFDFASEMISIHTEHAAQIEALAAAHGFVPVDGEVSAALIREGEDAMKTLQAASDPAHVYIRQQVEMHEKARVIVDGIIEHFDAGEFRDFLENTHAIVVAHEEHAIEILRGFQ